MPKHQYVEDGKVYEADSSTGTVEEVGTVTPTSGGLFGALEGILDGVFDTAKDGLEAVVDTVLPDSTKK